LTRSLTGRAMKEDLSISVDDVLVGSGRIIGNELVLAIEESEGAMAWDITKAVYARLKSKTWCVLTRSTPVIGRMPS
jgi:hypothetical protein